LVIPQKIIKSLNLRQGQNLNVKMPSKKIIIGISKKQGIYKIGFFSNPAKKRISKNNYL